ncbi:MAG: putative metal-binding motif-containing protein, partial [Candidatus Polarisedimenticolia bacterium]
ADDSLGTLTCGTGACQRTVAACVGGQSQTCTPGSPTAETCNGIDDDCDGAADDGFDQDADGFRTCDGDCNDLAAGTHPGAPEVCNGLDEDCNLVVDDGFLDSDGDLVADCVDPDDDNDQVPDVADCAPLNRSASIIPGDVGPTLRATAGAGTFAWTPVAQANVHNVYRGTLRSGGIETEASCLTSESPAPAFTDSEAPPAGGAFYYLVTGTNACGDGNPGTGSDGTPHTIAEACLPQGRDSDADQVVDRDDNCPLIANPVQPDSDRDGRGDVCDNCGAAPNPGQEDADSNGTGDHCQDLDGDGVPASEDCNEADPAVHPGATEACNGRDDDCDGAIDDLGQTTCGLGACQRSVPACLDGQPQTCTPGTPGTESCNGADDDCDGTTDEGFADTDADAHADCVDPDDDNDGAPDGDDNCPLIPNPGQADLDTDGLGDPCDDDQDGDTYGQTAGGAPVQTNASAEQRLQGTQNGTLASMQTSDNVYESIREARTGGVSVLDMRWTFTIPVGHLSVVFVEAHHDASSDGDDFVFAWSTDGTNFIDLVTVRKTADDNLPQYQALPGGTSGTLILRAQDTNRTTGSSQNTLFVDRIHIVTSDPADCDDRLASVNPAADEGPAGAATCSDTRDNNCDGRTDAADANCR